MNRWTDPCLIPCDKGLGKCAGPVGVSLFGGISYWCSWLVQGRCVVLVPMSQCWWLALGNFMGREL